MEKRLPSLIFFSRELSSNMPWRMARCITTRVSSKRNESRLSTPPWTSLPIFFYYFNYSHRLTLTRRKSSESGITLCLQWGMRNVRNKRMNSKFLHMFVHNINRKICEITNLLNQLQIQKGGNVRPEIMNRLKETKRSLPAWQTRVFLDH